MSIVIQIVCVGRGRLVDALCASHCFDSLHENTQKTSNNLSSIAQSGAFDKCLGTISKRKVNRMDTIRKLAELHAQNQLPKLMTGKNSNQAKSANFTDRLLIVMDTLIYALIEVLKDKLEAPSIGDVVRQAVRAYAIKLASTGSVDEDVGFQEESYTGNLKKLNIRIPSRTKERLEFLKGKTGASYTAIIFAGLGILAHSTDEQETVLRTLIQKETIDDNLSTSNVSEFTDIKTAILA